MTDPARRPAQPSSAHSRPRALPRATAALLALALAAFLLQPHARAQTPPPSASAGSSPAAAGRQVRTFDFDDPAILLSETQPPLNWRFGSEPRREGFPRWNRPLIDLDSPAASGSRSLRLPTKGGSTSLVLEPGVIGVFGGADYLITAAVRTEGLVHARAVLAARLLNQDGSPIPGSESRSQPTLTRNEWVTIGAVLRGQHEQAAFLQIELMLLQPDQLGANAGRFEVIPEDFAGSAWFDSVSVQQMARIELETVSPSGLFRDGERPTIEYRLRDFASDQLTLRLSCLDVDGEPIDQRERPVTSGSLLGTWEPRIHAAGWYSVTAELVDADGTVASSTAVTMIALPGGMLERDDLAEGLVRGGALDRATFGIRTHSDPGVQAEAISDLIDRSGLGQLWVPLWREQDDLAAISTRCELLRPAAQRLELTGGELALELTSVPADLVERLGIAPERPDRALARPVGSWAEYIEPALARLGGASRWILGSARGEPVPFDIDIAARAAEASRDLGRILPAPRVLLPWKATHSPLGQFSSPRGIVLEIDPAFDADTIENLAQPWQAHTQAADPRCISLHGSGEPGLSGRAAAAAVVKQAVATWVVFGPLDPATPPRGTGRSLACLLLDTPWLEHGPIEPRFLPTAPLAAFICTAERLRGRQVAAPIDLGPGIKAYLLMPRSASAADRGACLVAWTTGAVYEEEQTTLYLGEGAIRRIDMFGNETTVDQGVIPRRDIPFHILTLGDEPVFFENVDPELVYFLGTLAVDPPFLISVSENQPRELVLNNPWPIPLRGTAYIIDPGGFGDPTQAPDRSWTIEPRRQTFQVPPASQERLPFVMEAPSREESGPHRFVIDLRFESDRAYPLLRVVRHIDLGLPEVRLEASYRLGGAGPDGRDGLMVLAHVTNSGDTSISAEVTAVGRNLRAIATNIEQLKPGETVTKAMVYRETRDAVLGQTVRIVLRVRGQEGRLNRTIVVQ